MSFSQFQATAGNRFRFGLFMLRKLPSAFICGVRLRRLDEQHAVVSVPYKWLSQNPFRSTYFACQAMAAEMSTGVLAMGHTYGRNPPVSMLVTSVEAVFLKKATGRIYFTCHNGQDILSAIEKALAEGEGQTVTATSTGLNKAGEIISEFRIQWSFKARQKR